METVMSDKPYQPAIKQARLIAERAAEKEKAND